MNAIIRICRFALNISSNNKKEEDSGYIFVNVGSGSEYQQESRYIREEMR